jgi:hypothetical protein
MKPPALATPAARRSRLRVVAVCDRVGHKTEVMTVAQSEKQLANLRPPWPKGVSANPGGRPARPLTTAIEKLLGQKPNPEVLLALREFGLKPGATIADVVAICAFKECLRGRVDAMRWLSDLTEGRPYVRLQDLDAVGTTIELVMTMDKPIPRRELPAPTIENPVSSMIEKLAGQEDDDRLGSDSASDLPAVHDNQNPQK